jgi:hypothetical protein
MMRLNQTSLRPLVAILSLGLALGACACGSASSHHDSGGGSEQFLVKGGDNSIQEYGDEATGSEFAVAAAALHRYLDARAAGAWTAACGSLARPLIAQLVEVAAGQGGVSTCPKALKAISADVAPDVLREAARVDVAALRVEGATGVLLLRNEAGDGYFIAMVRKGDRWKVAAPAASPLQGG